MPLEKEDHNLRHSPATHAVAVTGYVYQKGKFLVLKRANQPLIWAPPGGRLKLDEDPHSGVLREVHEETGLNVQVVSLVDYWFGEIGTYGKLLSLDFLTLSDSDDVLLSNEHTDFAWATLDDLEHGNPPLGEDPSSFRLSDFQKAASECRRMMYLMPSPRCAISK
ncbi:MAG: NUDIX domain-containing protein [Candidatus Omnitrophica bacterium]|nr:NUDIX domain-containing protein [Candidatus Omnitrophota bacterium]